MARKVVVMPLIPGAIRRGATLRSRLDHAKYAVASWRWWCSRNQIEFLTVDHPVGGADFADKPPTLQRWLIPELVIRERGPDTRVAMVDADTMVRWDTPDFLDASAGFSAVAGRDGVWISRSIVAFRPLFPTVPLHRREYFNAGMVVVGHEELAGLRAFLDLVVERWPELRAIIEVGNVGSDQTPLNFVLRREQVRMTLLPPAYNLLHCFPLDAELFAMDKNPSADPALFASKAFARRDAFKFCDSGYIWHFSNVVGMRAAVMRETWRRVSAHYPGADPDP